MALLSIRLSNTTFWVWIIAKKRDLGVTEFEVLGYYLIAVSVTFVWIIIRKTFVTLVQTKKVFCLICSFPVTYIQCGAIGNGKA